MRSFIAMATVSVAAIATSVCAHAQVTVRYQDILEQPAAFYATESARRIADSVLRYQRPSGGWPKDIDMTRPSADGTAPSRPDATIDNGATTTEIRLLSLVASADQAGSSPSRERYMAAATRGIDYLLEAQYPNGGWPQFFPLRDDYSRHITFNDNAMVRVMTLLDEVSRGVAPFASTDAVRRERARTAVDRAVAVVLKAQTIVNGQLTAWGAQHDAVTLEPRPARAYEHVSLSSNESVGIVRFLMRRDPSPEVVRAVDAAVAWLTRARLDDGRWARFYEIGTNRPIFSGRDGIVRYKLEEIEKERREGYAWHGTWPVTLLEKQYPAWKARLSR